MCTHRFNGWCSDNPRRGDDEISEGAKVTRLLLELLVEAAGMVAVPTPRAAVANYFLNGVEEGDCGEN